MLKLSPCSVRVLCLLSHLRRRAEAQEMEARMGAAVARADLAPYAISKRARKRMRACLSVLPVLW